MLIFLLVFSITFSQGEQIIKKLPNGLDVFIHKNTSKEKETLFYLLIKVGSINETNKQLGYAHFLEHLAFKKGKRLNNQSIIDYFREQGLQIGNHYNAITNYDYTLFQVRVPNGATRKMQQKIFLFFADILDGLQLNSKDIETERKIVLAEKNVREIPKEEFIIKLGKSLYNNRLPIGTEKSITNASSKKIRKFYRKWYQPKNSAIFVVGNINTLKTTEIITEHLGSIKNANSSKFKKESIFKKLDNEIIVKTNSSLKETKTKVLLALKEDFDKEKNGVKRVFNAVLKDRIREVFLKTDMGVSVLYDYFLSDVGYFTISTTSESNSDKALEIIFTELKRLDYFGVSVEELELFKNKIRDKKPLDNLVNSFIMDEVVKAVVKNNTFEFRKKNNIADLNSLTVSDFKKYSKIFFKESKRLIFIEKNKEQIKTSQINEILKKVKNQKIEPYFLRKEKKKEKRESNQNDLKLQVLEAKKPIQEEQFKNIGVTKLTYQNGINVFLKPIKDGTNTFSVVASAKGGYTNIREEEFYKYESTDSYVDLGGVANLSYSEKDKYLADKNFGVSMVITDFERLIHSYTHKKDQHHFFKYLFAKLTDSKIDKLEFDEVIVEELFALHKQKKTRIKSFDKDRLVASLLGDYFPNRRVVKTESDYKELDIIEMHKLYQKAFKYSNNWNYVVVGDFSVDTIKPILNTYIGNLKVTLDPIKNIDFNYTNIPKVQKMNANDSNKTYALVLYIPYKNNSLKENLLLSLYEKYLGLKVTELLREKNGMVYFPAVSLSKIQSENPVAMLKIEYDCDARLFNKAKELMKNYFLKTRGNDIGNVVFKQIKAQVKLSFDTVLNSSEAHLWSSKLLDNIENITDLDNINSIFDSITKKEFSNFVNNIQKDSQKKSIEVN